MNEKRSPTPTVTAHEAFAGWECGWKHSDDAQLQVVGKLQLNALSNFGHHGQAQRLERQ